MAAAVADLGRGENIYKQVCSACHTMGVAGAPKLGDREAWAARLAQGQETLNQHSLQGIRGMPPKGGRVDLPDAVILDAVAYMLKESS
jgi:cytochrome c5